MVKSTGGCDAGGTKGARSRGNPRGRGAAHSQAVFGKQLIVLGVLGMQQPAWADTPAMAVGADEPGITSSTGASEGLTRFRVELGFGFASLLDDPDVDEGYGGGIAIAYGLHQRFGVEATVFVANNPYAGALGDLGDFSSFIAGNISLGPFVQLTRPGSRLAVIAETTLGAYLIIPPVPTQEDVWALGVSFGLSLSYKFTRWFSAGIKWRYHLFNLASLTGNDIVDRKAFQTIGVIDRMEIPINVAYHF